MSGRPTINLGCFVLCRITSMVRNMAAAPPKAANITRVASAILVLPFFFDLSLSDMQAMTDTTEKTETTTSKIQDVIDFGSELPAHVIFKYEIIISLSVRLCPLFLHGGRLLFFELVRLSLCHFVTAFVIWVSRVSFYPFVFHLVDVLEGEQFFP